MDGLKTFGQNISYIGPCVVHFWPILYPFDYILGPECPERIVAQKDAWNDASIYLDGLADIAVSCCYYGFLMPNWDILGIVKVFLCCKSTSLSEEAPLSQFFLTNWLHDMITLTCMRMVYVYIYNILFIYIIWCLHLYTYNIHIKQNLI